VRDGQALGPLTALSERERARALERFRLLRPHLQEGLPLARLVREHGVVLRTALRWLRRYREQGLAGLARWRRSDRGSRSFPAELVRFVEGLALQVPPQSIAAVHRHAVAVAMEQGWTIPGYGTVYGLIRRLDPGVVALAHDGPKAYRERFDLSHRREADGPNAIW
jgi:putative transposase